MSTYQNADQEPVATARQTRPVVYRTSGHQHGPIRRLVSPGELGELIKPFVFLDQIDVELTEPVNFGFHPHSGIATLTLLLEGGFQYEDSTGKQGQMGSGSVEWMQAGRGIWHAGRSFGSRLRGYQLWLALEPPLELDPPRSLYLEPGCFESRGPARLVLGEWEGMRSPIPAPAPINYLEVNLKAGECWRYQPPPGHDVAWVAVHQGALHAPERLVSSELAVFQQGNGAIELRADGDTAFVLGSAAKHPHPLVLGSYSVHSSASNLLAGTTEIARAAISLRRAGKLRWPG